MAVERSNDTSVPPVETAMRYMPVRRSPWKQARAVPLRRQRSQAGVIKKNATTKDYVVLNLRR